VQTYVRLQDRRLAHHLAATSLRTRFVKQARTTSNYQQFGATGQERFPQNANRRTDQSATEGAMACAASPARSQATSRQTSQSFRWQTVVDVLSTLKVDFLTHEKLKTRYTQCRSGSKWTVTTTHPEAWCDKTWIAHVDKQQLRSSAALNQGCYKCLIRWFLASFIPL